MASLVKDLVDAGIHFGHSSTHWNPKMGPYIFGRRNKIHIVDVKETVKGLLLARKFLTKTVAGGKDVLFVGTKRQARGIIEENVREVGMHYVTERWLGGTLTNFRTIRERLKRLEELEALEESGEIANYSKKMEATLNREKSKILRNLEGIRHMSSIPGAMVVIDVKFELNALKEARKLGIPTVCLADTDADPDYCDIPIPGNDDAMRAIEVVVKSLAAACAEGKSARAQQAMTETEGAEDQHSGDAGPGPLGPDGKPRRKRSRRAQFSADAGGPEPGSPEAAAAQVEAAHAEAQDGGTAAPPVPEPTPQPEPTPEPEPANSSTG